MESVAQRWRHEVYQSGTQVVTTGNGPWLYVYGPVGDEHGRGVMCQELAAFLNGGTRPAWLDDMERRSESSLTGADGSSITSTGPMFDSNPPALAWRERQDDAAKNDRARLIDSLRTRKDTTL